MKNEKVAILRKNGTTLYGRVVDTKGKLGQYEVEHDFRKTDRIVYATFAEAEKRFNVLSAEKVQSSIKE